MLGVVADDTDLFWLMQSSPAFKHNKNGQQNVPYCEKSAHEQGSGLAGRYLYTRLFYLHDVPYSCLDIQDIIAQPSFGANDQCEVGK